MKKYIKPAIEVLNLGATMPLMASQIYIDNGTTIIDPTGGDGGGDGGYGQWAPSRKGRVYVEEDDEDEGFGW